jgi:hypothetical protein
VIDDDDMPAPRDGICGDAGLYLLGMLDDRQTGDFLAHADGCTVCREELGALQPAIDVLGSRVPQLAAPVHVKRSVMSVARAEAPPTTRAPRASGRWHELVLRARARRMMLALAAACLLIVGVVIGAASFPQSTARSTHAVNARVTIVGASAVLHESGGHEWLTILGLPAPRRGHVYEVWLKAGGGSPRPTSSLFSPTRAGAATVDVPPIAGKRREVMVTQEPGGGSAQPTSAPVIVARL